MTAPPKAATRLGARIVLTAMIVAPVAVGAPLIAGIVLGRGAGFAGLTVTALLAWIEVALLTVALVGGLLLGRPLGPGEDRSWAIGAPISAGLALALASTVAVGPRLLPALNWELIGAVRGPAHAFAGLVLALLIAERLALTGSPKRARAATRGVWALAASCWLLVDGFLPASLQLSAVAGGLTSPLVLVLVAAGVYGALLQAGGLRHLASAGEAVSDLDGSDW